jgi:hypothetical protein
MLPSCPYWQRQASLGLYSKFGFVFLHVTNTCATVYMISTSVATVCYSACVVSCCVSAGTSKQHNTVCSCGVMRLDSRQMTAVTAAKQCDIQMLMLAPGSWLVGIPLHDMTPCMLHDGRQVAAFPVVTYEPCQAEQSMCL